ncbi:MAG: transposase [Coleofasciculaceae cyanobacterium RL_1_1]|nr:transposase [Coleofasciculaceae cyanobacterium RL_1_1]
MSKRRNFLVGHYYHVYNRGNDRQAIFFHHENYRHFLRLLRHHLVERKIVIVAYCLMPNHYHLLVYLNSEEFSQRMQVFSMAYTKAMNERYERVGSLFQGRFRAIEVQDEAYLLHLTRYIHLNPVKANLVARVEDWEFSSYREYVELRGGTLPCRDRVEFGSAAIYRAFVEDGLGRFDRSIQGLMLDE